MAVELGAGYISLSVRFAEGMKAATKGIEKSAAGAGKKAGKKLGDELGKNVEKSGRRYIEGVEDLIAKREKDRAAAAERADEARTKKRIEHEERVQGYARREEERRAEQAKKKADEVAARQKQKAQEVAKEQNKQADQVAKRQQTAWGGVYDEMRARAKAMGYDLDKELTKAAGRVGKNIGDAIAGTKAGDVLRDVAEWAGRADVAIGGINQAIEAYKAGDPAGVFNSTAQALDAIGQTGAAEAMRDAGSKAATAQDQFKQAKGAIEDTTGMLLALSGSSGTIAEGLGAISAAAGPLAAAFAAIQQIPGWKEAAGGVLGQVTGKAPFNWRQWVNTMVPGTNIIDRAMGNLGLGGPQMNLGPAPLAPPPINVDAQNAIILGQGEAPTAPPPTTMDAKMRALMGLARGGVIRGPGTGTSDSVLARLSVGEGVVNARAMRAGGAGIVSALNTAIPGLAGGLPGGTVSYTPGWVQSAGLKPLYTPGTSEVPGWATALGNKFGLATSTYTTGGSLHSAGFAFDFGAPGANAASMERMAAYIMGNLKKDTLQLIFQSPTTGKRYGIAGGEDVSGTGYYAGDYPGHTDHVHWAPARVPTVAGGGGGRSRAITGRPYTGGGRAAPAAAGGGGGGGGVPIMPGPGGTWTSPSPEWAALIARESGGRPSVVQGITDINTGGNEASGLFQIAKGTWAGAGGTAYAPTAGQATPQQQAQVAANIFRAQGGGPWGAGLAGRESEAGLRAGLTDFGDDLGGTSDYLGDFGDEIQTKTTDLGAFDQSLTGATSTLGGMAPGGEAAGGAADMFDTLGQLGDIAMGGVKETLLPPGFSDPTEWPLIKSAGALMGFMGGKIGGPGGAVLSAGGAGLMGSPSGALSALKGIMPQGYGQLEPGGPAMRPEEFSAMSTGAGASLAEGFVDAAQGFIPDVQQPQNIDNSIHVGENGTVGQDPTAVRDGIRRDQRTQDRAYATTMRGMPGP